jgi:NAD(P)-dependent dehydrogenase (short-subunit alcohol dehydrogenase family)
MLLSGKNALVFGASGAIASAVSRRFAEEGATVFVSARDDTAIKELVEDITTNGGEAHGDHVDSTDPAEVDAYVDRVARSAASIDVVFNGTGSRPGQLGYPAFSTDQPLEDFLGPMRIMVGSQFLTARAAARHMKDAGAGTIVLLSTGLAMAPSPLVAGVAAASAAVEAMTRSLAAELGEHGIRVNCIRPQGMPETRTIQETVAGFARLGVQPWFAPRPLGTLTVAETADAVVVAASGRTSGMTGQVVVL